MALWSSALFAVWINETEKLRDLNARLHDWNKH